MAPPSSTSLLPLTEARGAEVASQCAGARGRGRHQGNARAAPAALWGGKHRCCYAGCWRGCECGGDWAARADAGRDPGRGVRALAVEGHPGHPRGDGEGAGPATAVPGGKVGAQRDRLARLDVHRFVFVL